MLTQLPKLDRLYTAKNVVLDTRHVLLQSLTSLRYGLTVVVTVHPTDAYLRWEDPLRKSDVPSLREPVARRRVTETELPGKKQEPLTRVQPRKRRT